MFAWLVLLISEHTQPARAVSAFAHTHTYIIPASPRDRERDRVRGHNELFSQNGALMKGERLFNVADESVPRKLIMRCRLS
jgi:hypothetical protein